MWKHKINEFWGKLQLQPTKIPRLQISINHICSNLMQLEGISTKHLDTKSYLMS